MNVKNILETISMIEEQKLDIRTITMGISLLDCIDSDGEKSRASPLSPAAANMDFQ